MLAALRDSPSVTDATSTSGADVWLAMLTLRSYFSDQDSVAVSSNQGRWKFALESLCSKVWLKLFINAAGPITAS